MLGHGQVVAHTRSGKKCLKRSGMSSSTLSLLSLLLLRVWTPYNMYATTWCGFPARRTVFSMNKHQGDCIGQGGLSRCIVLTSSLKEHTMRVCCRKHYN